MSAEKFFNEHSIEEISKKTKISPISLRFIKNKEFDKITRVKFVGFIKLIEREFNVDLSELIKEFDAANNIKKTPQKQQNIETPKTETPKKEKGILLYVLVFLILIISGTVLYLSTKQKTEPTPQPEMNLTLSQNVQTEKNNTFENEETAVNNETNTSTAENIQNTQKTVEKENIQTSQNKTQTVTTVKNVTIIPHEKVWYRAVNLDTNKTYEYLTTKVHTLPGSNYYIKFGHGNVTIEYGDMNITPNTKKIVRILLKNGKYEYVKGKK